MAKARITDDAIWWISEIVRRRKSEPQRPIEPLGLFLLAGPTQGEAVRVAHGVAEALYGDPAAVLRLDMAGYKEKHQIGLLVGPPPTMVGYGPPGHLPEPVRLRPEQVVLLERIERAHADAQNLLLYIAEQAPFIDNYGREVDFRQAAIILTTEAGVVPREVIRPELFVLLDVIDFGSTEGGDQRSASRVRPAGERRTMSPQPGARLSYEDSCRLLHRLGGLGDGPIPPMPARRPRHDDEQPFGVRFFRTVVRGVDLEDLTLPRTFFGRSEIGPMSFRNTDLSESTLCWNDFIEVDFTDCDLSGSDLRASKFVGVKFVRAVLGNADLRRSHFEGCDFTDADLQGAKLTYVQGASLYLSDEQRRVIDWRLQAGEEPKGG